MEPSFLEQFFPRIINVHKREPSFWDQNKHVVRVASAKIRNFLYIYNGQGELELEGECYPLSRGDVFHVSPKEQFHLVSSPEFPLLYYSVHYDYKRIVWRGDSVQCLDPTEKGLPFPPYLQFEERELMESRLQHLYEVWSRKDVDHEWKERLTFMEILSDINDRQRQIEQEEHDSAQLIFNSMEYIRTHYDQPLSRGMLAERALLSINHFSMLFRQYSGYTPMQYMTTIRLDKAKQLLRTSHMPIAEVARSVGFQDPLYFTRVFSKEIGFSPSEYRKA